VLWVAIHALLNPIPGKQYSLAQKKRLTIAIYSGDRDKDKITILQNVQKKFGLQFTESQAQKIEIVYIRTRSLLEAKYYPIATMIGQSLGSMLVGIECIYRLTPHIFVDSIGAPFTFPIVKLLTRAKILAYVHYPVISEVCVRCNVFGLFRSSICFYVIAAIYNCIV
jgi:alpha-1,2-mannosyltransferase